MKDLEQREMDVRVRTANNHGLAQTSIYYGVDKTEIDRVGKDFNWVAGTSKRLDDTNKKNPTIFEEVSLEYLQSTNMTAYKYLFDKHGARLATSIYNQGAKYAGTGLESALHVDGKAVGATIGTAIPFPIFGTVAGFVVGVGVGFIANKE